MIVRTQKQFDEALEKLNKVDILAVDTETEMFSKEKNHAFLLDLDGIGFYGKNVKCFIFKDILFKTEENKKAIQNILDSKIQIMHNAKFDLTVFEAHGFNIDNIKYHDTMLMSWLLNNARRSHGLKYLAESVLKIKKEKIVEFKDVAKKPDTAKHTLFPDWTKKELKQWEDNLGNYCIDDCKYTYKLYEKFKLKLEKDKRLYADYIHLELPFLRVLQKMETRGIKLDTQYLEDMGKKMEEELITIKSDILKEAGRDIDINSSKQLSELLYNEMGYKLTDEYKTATGAYSTNVAALKHIQANQKCTIVDLILKYREVFKLHSTYVLGLLNRQIENTIHASFLQHGTDTGRLSGSSPNLQNIPRRDDEYNIRYAFVPRDGFKFIISDYSQVELRILAYFSKDPTLIKAYQDGKDIHQQTADLVGCERFAAKAINFGIAYGQSAYGLSKSLDITIEEAEKFISDYFRQFKQLEIFIGNAHNTIRKHYMVKTILGRKRHFPQYPKARKERDWKTIKGLERQSVNTIIQGCLHGDTLVYDKDLGIKPIREISKIGTGDFVWDGISFTKGWCVGSGKKQLFKIHLNNGQVIQCSKDHKFLLKNTRGNVDWKDTLSITKGDRLCISENNKFNYTKIPKLKNYPKTTHWKAPNGIANQKQCSITKLENYSDIGLLLGRLASDGSVIKNKACYWLIATHEKEIEKVILPLLEKVSNVRKPKTKRADIHSLIIDSSMLATEMDKMGVKSRIPDMCWKDIECLRGYLKGYFDGDGGISGQLVVLTFANKPKNIIHATEIQKALLFFGIRSRLKIYKSSIRLKIYKRDNRKFRDEIGFINIKKTEKIPLDYTMSELGNDFVIVDKVEITMEYVDMYDVVNTDKGYFIADGLITHNSAADVIKMAMRNLDRVLSKYGAFLLVQIHDELVIECPEEKCEELMPIVKKVMEEAIPLKGVPLVTEPFIADRWQK